MRFAVDEAALERSVLRAVRRLLPPDRSASRVETASSDRDAEALMTVFRNDGAWDTSNVDLRRALRAVRYDKHEPDPAAAGMHHIDYGLSVLPAELGAGAHPAATTERPRRPVPYTQPRRPTGGIRGPAAILRDRLPGRHRRPATPPGISRDDDSPLTRDHASRPRRRRRGPEAVDRHPGAQRGADGHRVRRVVPGRAGRRGVPGEILIVDSSDDDTGERALAPGRGCSTCRSAGWDAPTSTRCPSSAGNGSSWVTPIARTTSVRSHRSSSASARDTST